MLVGLFSNIGIFAITAFADLSSGAQTDWKVIVGDYYYASTESNASNGMLTTMSGSSTGNGAFTKATELYSPVGLGWDVRMQHTAA